MHSVKKSIIATIVTSALSLSAVNAVANEQYPVDNIVSPIEYDYTPTQSVNVVQQLQDDLNRISSNPAAQQLAGVYAVYFTVLALIGILIPVGIYTRSSDKGNAKGSSYDLKKPFTSEVNQGDLIYIRDRACTIGYIDKINKIAYTAGHCGFTDEKVNVMNSSRQTIGTLYTEYSRERTPYVSADKAVIYLNDDVKPGENTFSGDVKLHYTNVSEGDTICSFSRMDQQTMCGTVLYTAHNSVGATRSAAGVRGDSGGPAWIDGKGFVGLYVGFADNDGEDTLFSMIPQLI